MSLFSSYVLKAVPASEYYKKRLPEWSGQPATNISCPFAEEKHQNGTDNSRSFSVNIGIVAGCYCHACKTSIGSIVHFEKLIKNLQSDDEAAQILYAEFIHPVIDFDGEFCAKTTQHRDSLYRRPEAQELLRSELGFTPEMVDKFRIGFDEKSFRFTFPVFNQWDALINIRYYQPPSERRNPKYPKIYNEKGFGQQCLYPLNLLDQTPNPSKVLYWMKAERDVILTWSLGLMAFCSIGGEAADASKFLPYLRRLGVHIIVVGDNDEVGRKSRDEKIINLQSLKIPGGYVEIPPEQKDFSDWILKEHKTAGDFLLLPEISNEKPPEELQLEEEEEILLAPGVVDATTNSMEGDFTIADIGRRPELLNSSIKVQGVISGHLDRTFSVPYIFEINGQLYRLPISRELLNLCKSEDYEMQLMLKKIFKVKNDVKFRQFITVTEVEVVPVLIPGVDTPYVNQRCFIFGSQI